LPAPLDTSASSELPDAALAGAAVRGSVWQGLAFLVGRAFTLIATVVLARLLDPQEFGLVGLALVFILFAETLAVFGVAEALVYLPASRRTTDAAFVLSVAAGGGLLLVGLAFAPVAAEFFHRPDVTDLFRPLLLGLFLAAAAEVPDALLRRDLAFRKRMFTELARALTQGAVSISLAATGFGPWALVWGYVAGNFAWASVSWALVSYRPEPGWWRIESVVARPLLSFGLPASGHALLAALILDVDYVIVGRVLGPSALGEYTLAFRMPQLLVLNVFVILAAVAFPLFSRVRGDPDRLRRGYLTSIRLQSAYGLGVSVGLAVVAPILIPAIFGAEWAAAAPPAQALALYAGFRSLGTGAVDVYKGIGRPGIAAAVSLLRLTVLIPVLLLVASSGIEAVAWAQAVAALAFAILMQTVACRVVRVRISELARALWPGLALAVGVGLGAALGRFGIPGPLGLRLAVSAVAGTGGGLAAVWFADRRFVEETVSLVLPTWRRPAAEP
jgi:lipopolysaccharide exporter